MGGQVRARQKEERDREQQEVGEIERGKGNRQRETEKSGIEQRQQGTRGKVRTAMGQRVRMGAGGDLLAPKGQKTQREGGERDVARPGGHPGRAADILGGVLRPKSSPDPPLVPG